jgi:hypothetical protein
MFQQGRQGGKVYVRGMKKSMKEVEEEMKSTKISFMVK